MRLECPYLDRRSEGYGKLSSGRGMEEAYSRLERCIVRDHLDRLEEFEKTFEGR